VTGIEGTFKACDWSKFSIFYPRSCSWHHRSAVIYCCPFLLVVEPLSIERVVGHTTIASKVRTATTHARTTCSHRHRTIPLTSLRQARRSSPLLSILALIQGGTTIPSARCVLTVGAGPPSLPFTSQSSSAMSSNQPNSSGPPNTPHTPNAQSNPTSNTASTNATTDGEAQMPVVHATSNDGPHPEISVLMQDEPKGENSNT
jgi:hypothetical protein